ncbi:MAG TPA: molybdopterin-dependent oxidoreductase [Rugosimonospora sp.]|nr:molybdopterin-dependent oxidoreductase [Rugosimonospora sp.]
MQRRNFLKISALSGAVAALQSCGSPEQQLIRFIPDEDLVPGIATWKPSVCTLCSAGCGTLVRVMEGDAEVVRNGRAGLIKMGLAKKLEGNPEHPVNRGKLCARGHAALQVLYHPDRLANPLKRRGPRGSADFQVVSWEDALAELTSHLSELPSPGNVRPSDSRGGRRAVETGPVPIAFLTRPLRGQRRELIERFLKALGAPPSVSYEPLDEAVLRRANLLSFGSAALPTLDLARADYLISFGADLLGTWNSPVAQSIGYGEMRQGRPGRRGKFVQVESRMSQTGANADEWIPCHPGREGVLALGMAHVILREKLRPRELRSRAAALIAGWSESLPDYVPESVAKQTGVSAETITRLAHEIAAAASSAVVIAGAPLAQTNGMFNALAVNALQALLESGRAEAPILSFTPQPPIGATVPASAATQASFSALNSLAQAILNEQPHAPKVLFLYDANPVFGAPASLQFREALAKVPYIVSFGSFIDETSAFADLILPDHAPLESWVDDVAESGTTQSVVSLAPPAVHPLHNTRAMPDVLLEVAQRLGGPVAAALPWNSYDAMLRAAYVPLRRLSSSTATQSEGDFWTKITNQGGWWSTPTTPRAEAVSAAPAHTPAKLAEPEFDGPAPEFPFYFAPFPSQSFRDGSLAHLPWLQEMPDVITTAMWSSWMEINPKTAGQLHIAVGDLVEITSQHGSVRAPAILSPGIAPDVVAMPIGQGHEKFSRYASGRGANPLSILAPLTERETGALAWAATRVKLARVGGAEQGKLIVFAGGMSRFPAEEERR